MVMTELLNGYTVSVIVEHAVLQLLVCRSSSSHRPRLLNPSRPYTMRAGQSGQRINPCCLFRIQSYTACTMTGNAGKSVLCFQEQFVTALTVLNEMLQVTSGPSVDFSAI